ncbi:hypothetical protein HYV49_00280 [Candidatus Pacearchaeota archaeon]|nr:hypothetical protein [Candidatus Pacearchaeota archaeon]
MAKIGTFYTPDIKLSEAFEIINRIYKEKIKTADGLATLLGHENARSGTFQNKLSALKKLGLINSGTLGINLTQTAEKIVLPKNPLEKDEGYKEVFQRMPLFLKIREKLGSNLVDSQNFWVHLMEITGIGRSDAEAEATRIRNIYMDSLRYMTQTSDVSDVGGEKMVDSISASVQQDFIEIKTKDSVVRIPSNLESIRRVKKMLDFEEENLMNKLKEK